MRVWPLKDTGGVMDIQKERKAFEKALVDKCSFNPESSFSVDDKGEYKSDATHFGWAMWQAAKAQAVPNLHYEILVKSIIAHVDSHLEANSFVVGDSFDRGWKAAMQCVRNNITMVSKRKDLANAKK